MTHVDIYLLMQTRPSAACGLKKLTSLLHTLDGVEHVSTKNLRGRPLFKVVYDPAIGNSSAILQAMEHTGCPARMIAL